MADIENDLKATRDDLITDAQRLAAIETEKRQLHPKDPRVVELSREAEALAKRMATKAIAETELSEEVAAE